VAAGKAVDVRVFNGDKAELPHEIERLPDFTSRRIVLFTNTLIHGIVKAVPGKGRYKC